MAPLVFISRKLRVLERIKRGKEDTVGRAERRRPAGDEGGGEGTVRSARMEERNGIEGEAEGEVMRRSQSKADFAFQRSSDAGRSRSISEKGRRGAVEYSVATVRSESKTIKVTL